jgi:hypothetical protein
VVEPLQEVKQYDFGVEPLHTTGDEAGSLHHTTPPSTAGVIGSGKARVGAERKVVVVGLPKTGTSSMTAAMHMLGFNLMHGHGGASVLSGTKCDGLANTMEHEYESLYKEFPESVWFITKPGNVTRWLESLEFHLAYSKKNYNPECSGAHRIFGFPALREWVASTTGLSQPTGCDFGGGAYLKVYFEEYYRRVLRTGILHRQ